MIIFFLSRLIHSQMTMIMFPMWNFFFSPQVSMGGEHSNACVCYKYFSPFVTELRETHTTQRLCSFTMFNRIATTTTKKTSSIEEKNLLQFTRYNRPTTLKINTY